MKLVYRLLADMNKLVYRHLAEQKWRNKGALDLLVRLPTTTLHAHR
jgi:hypothetical protein